MRPGDRYLQVLSVLAVVQLVAVHAFGRPWLPLLFPALGVLLALAGAQAAAAVDAAVTARAFLRQRVWRLLLPFWVFGVVMVTAMLVRGWRADEQLGSEPLTWGTAWLWVLPLSDPPASTQGYAWVGLTSFVTSYLWLLLLSPALLWLFRRWPLRVMAVPIVTLLLVSIGLVTMTGRTYDVVTQLCAFLCCWLLGFARRDGALRRLPAARTVAGGALLMAAGVGFAWWQRNQYGTWNVDDIPLAAGLYSLGAVLVLLRIHPRPGRPAPVPVPGLRRLASLLSRRGVTVVLWANVAITVARLVLERTPLARFDTGGPAAALLFYGLAWLVLLGVVLTVGRLEQIGAFPRRVVLRDNVVAGPLLLPGPAPVPAVEHRPEVEALRS